MKLCPICQKGSTVVGGYSNRIRATKFNPTGKNRKQPNLQWATLPVGTVGAKRIKICTNCLKKNRQLTYRPA